MVKGKQLTYELPHMIIQDFKHNAKLSETKDLICK